MTSKLPQKARTKQLNAFVSIEYGSNDQASLSVNLGELPAPTKSVVADWMLCTTEGQDFKVYFGQKQPFGSRLVAAIAISMPILDLIKLVPLYTDFYSTLYRYIETTYDEIPSPDSVGDSEEFFPTERVVFQRASYIAMAFAGHNAEARFYRISPHELQEAKRIKRKRPNISVVHPVVEIEISTLHLFHLCKSLEEVARKCNSE